MIIIYNGLVKIQLEKLCWGSRGSHSITKIKLQLIITFKITIIWDAYHC